MKTERIMHQYIRPANLRRGMDEAKDCFVVALAIAAGLDYSEAHAIAARHFGRLPREGVELHDVHTAVGRTGENVFDGLVRFRLEWGHARGMAGPKTITLGRFISEHPDGCFIACTERARVSATKVDTHAFAIRRGWVLDEKNWRHSPGLRLCFVHRITRALARSRG